ncbi:MAG: hypothetical protein NC092_02260 [Butyrivibrio sp.]|nr:hypothetical protein [Muribaculum sp.]MCM1551497.1 hypothetical protein [Butyrivibrio sp.]
MSKYNSFNVNLNIHPNAPKEVWDKVQKIYAEMPYWSGFMEGTPIWYGPGDIIIEASPEPGGLHFYAEMPQDEWESWICTFRNRATEELGYEIGEPEEGYPFRFV